MSQIAGKNYCTRIFKYNVLNMARNNVQTLATSYIQSLKNGTFRRIKQLIRANIVISDRRFFIETKKQH